MFGSNVQPKKTKKIVEDWYCMKCDTEIRHWHSKCPTCGTHRTNDDGYRKGGA